MRALALLALAALAGGCVAAVPEPATPKAPPTDPTTAPREQVVTQARRDTSHDPTSWNESIAISGMLPAGACATRVPDACIGGGARHDLRRDHPLSERYLALELILVWDAATATTERLRLDLLRVTRCGDGCEKTRLLVEGVEGLSPLTLAATAPLLAENEWLAAQVAAPGAGHAALGASAQTEQDYRIVGVGSVVAQALH